MLTPKLSEVIFFFLVLSATPGPVELRGPRGPMGPWGTRGPLASPILGPDKGKTFFLKCSPIFFIKKWNSPSVIYKKPVAQCYSRAGGA